MEEAEYRDNEKVLYKVRCKLSLPHKESKEAECFVTEGHVLIEAEELIKIPRSGIKKCQISIDSQAVSCSWTQEPSPRSGTATLTFLDDLNKKHELSLEMSAGDVGYFKQMTEQRTGQAEIKEIDEQHRVIEVYRQVGVKWIFGLVLAIVVFILFVQIIPIMIGKVLIGLLGIYSILFMLRMPMTIRIVLDKSTQTITVRKPSPFLVRRNRVTPFSYVSSVLIDYAPDEEYDLWAVSLKIGRKSLRSLVLTTKRICFI